MSDPTLSNRDALAMCHTGGIDHVIHGPSELMEPIIQRLMSCTRHGASHVFVVDQSHVDSVTVGMSVNGWDCIKDLRDDP